MKVDNLIIRITNRYIGVSGGYLGDFTYRTHREFYPEYCDLLKNPDSIEGTTRMRFISIFSSASSKERAKIIRGIIERFPAGSGPVTRTELLKQQLLEEISKLDLAEYIGEPELEVKSDLVLEALEDASSLIENRKAVSAVDRVHTAFYGYLRTVCKQEKIDFNQNDDLVSLMKKIFSSHTKLMISVKSKEIQNIVRNLTSISDSLNPVRNQGSRAHPNEKVLDDPEAVLVVNTVRSILIYIDSKIK